jgi:hypothetical protein
MHGNNLKFRIVRPTNRPDDEIGGANISGVVIAEDVEGRIEEAKATMVLLQQGVDVTSVYRGQSRPVDMEENDEITVTFPPYHNFYGKIFEVVSLQEPSTNPRDGRGMRLFHLRRKDNARSVYS